MNVIQDLILLPEFFRFFLFSFCLYVPILRRSSTDCSTSLLILYDLFIKKCIKIDILGAIKPKHWHVDLLYKKL